MSKNIKKIDLNPLVSFCIATYKRPEFLKSTLESLLKQTYKNIEIIVSDNDPKGSSKIVVDKLKNSSVKYYKNKINVGIEKNFNKAIKHAKGKFVILLSDDDPLKPFMVNTLVKLYRKYPEYDNFYGACNLYVKDDEIARAYGLSLGETSMRDQLKSLEKVSLYEKSEFMTDYLTYKILPYFWWSGGMIRRTLLKKIGGMPYYGSLFFTDFCFVSLIGLNGKTVVINKELGNQTIHKSNSLRSKKDLLQLIKGYRGYTKLISPYLGIIEKKIMHKFLAKWIMDHLLFMKRIHEKLNYDYDNKFYIEFFDYLAHRIQDLGEYKREFELRLRYPIIFNFIFYYLNYTKPSKVITLLERFKNRYE